MSRNTLGAHTWTDYLEGMGEDPSPLTLHPLQVMQFSDTFATKQRIDVLECMDFCQRCTEGMTYHPERYRPDGRLLDHAAQYLHQLMGYRAEHSDPLQF